MVKMGIQWLPMVDDGAKEWVSFRRGLVTSSTSYPKGHAITPFSASVRRRLPQELGTKDVLTGGNAGVPIPSYVHHWAADSHRRCSKLMELILCQV